MATPFAFVPRAVSKYTIPWEGISRRSPSRSSSPHSTTDYEEDDEDDSCGSTAPSSLDKAKGKEKATGSANAKQSAIAQDIASLISLALSDYNIWRDADMRWKLDASLGDEASTDGAGFVPINYLLRRAPFRGSLSLGSGLSDPSEMEVVKALRTHASHILEVQMRLPSSSSVWYGTGKTSRKKDVGAYEVRRKDWATLGDRPLRGWPRARWDDMTLYMECIPPQYRTVGSIARFTETLLSLLSEPETNIEPRFCVQCVTFPPHYLDKPGDTPKCKGYALVIFSTKAGADAILRAWPWKRHPVLVAAKVEEEGEEEDGEASPAVKEAHKYGFRTIPKVRWDALNEEYLLYKQRIVDEMARTQTTVHHLDEHATEHVHERVESAASHPDTDLHADVRVQTEIQTQTQTTPCSPYPFDCLVFVRNIHPETNKTTLKSLFSQAFRDGGEAEQGSVTADLDYVDFNKGMDTCFLRLASPNHATRLTVHFDAQQKAQAHGLDATGRAPLANEKPIMMERIQGKKEEVYWDKVPEKVRRQVVDKAVKTQLTPTPCGAHENGQKKRSRKP